MCDIILIRHGDNCRKEDEQHDIDRLTQTAILKSREYPEILKTYGIIPNAIFYERAKGDDIINRCKKTIESFQMEALPSTIPEAIEMIREEGYSMSIISYMSEHVHQFPSITNEHYLRHYVGSDKHIPMSKIHKDLLYKEMLHFRLNDRGMEYIDFYPTNTQKGDETFGYLPEDF
jgi:hypothetical protein